MRRPSFRPTRAALLLWFVATALVADVRAADDYTLHTFQRQQLTDVYFSEGAATGDINGDGHTDIVYGPYWFEGPQLTTKHEIYKPVPQNREAYADNFFSWVYDFDRDGAQDVLVVGFPGTPAYVYRNPGPEGIGGHWTKHEVLDWVSNESPQFTNLVGDDRPELVCTRDGFFGFATVDWQHPFQSWTFHPISPQVAAKRFGHGLGVGDIDGDGRMDVLHAKGWLRQPQSDAVGSRWQEHPASFTDAYGGAEMYAYDVDGDGDNDVITSLAAHDFGLAWYEQLRDGDDITFQQHLIMGDHRSENRYGVLFSEPHSVALADIDGDGLKDIVTGKTYYSHHQQSPLWDAGAVVYWFRLVRGENGVDWVPYLADEEAGIGRQVSVADVNGDSHPDIVVGGMKGAHVLTQRRAHLDKLAWDKAQPKPYEGPPAPSAEGASAVRGPKAPINAASGRVPGAIEGESLTPRVSGGQARPQPMGSFAGDNWSGDAQLWWTGGRPGDTLQLPLPPTTGTVDVELVLTCARDYGIVQPMLDGQKLGDPVDLYHDGVITTGVLSYPKQQLKPGEHTLTLQIVGRNPKAKETFMVGLDYVRLAVPGEQPRGADAGIAAKAADGRVLNLDFETGTLQDWTAEGQAFQDQPIKGDTVAPRRSGMRSGHRGEYWIGGYEKLGDQPVGTLVSVPFEVSHPYATFLANGGPSDETRVELVRADSGEPFYSVSGEEAETMRQVVVDLRGHVGKQIFIRLVDERRGGWGHVNFDHFRFHSERPGRITPPTIRLVDDEYPHAGLTAQQAAEAMTLPDGFRVLVGAAEPDVKQPIAMALDDRGRVWIAEAYEYPLRAAEGKGRDRIVIFDDTDGDGTLDRSKVFAEGLNLVSGLEVGFGGVWVGAAPYLLFIPDHDGDDVPDAEPQILLDGWGFQDTHETLNAFIWGPDGWLYGCHGVFTHSLVGPPGTPEDQRTPLNAAIWRYHPTRHQFEVFAHGTSNPWGIDFDDRGQAFATACVIPHLYHIIQSGRYQRQAGQHFNRHTYRDIVTIADHLHYLGATPHSGNSKSDEAGGGHAHAGAMVYLGGSWPDQYRNHIFMNNIHGQRLNTDILHPHGSGYVGSHGPDFLLTGDQASQILNLRYGPDGQAWMIDWYDMQACHRREAELHDRSNGRIYKIVYGDPQPVTVDLNQQSDRELAELALHENDWYVRHARRVLQHRAATGELDPQARQRLAEIASDHPQETRRLRAAWALHVTGGLSDQQTAMLLDDASPYVRGWAVQLAMENQQSAISDALHQRLVEMARDDSSPVVRLYIASALTRVSEDQRWPVLTALASHAEDAEDHNLPLMYWYAAEPLAEGDPERALAFGLAAGESIPLLREFMLRRIGSSDAAAALDVLVAGLGKADTAQLQLTFLTAIRAALQGQRKVKAPAEWSGVYKRIVDSSHPEVRVQATALGVTFGDSRAMESLRQLVTNTSMPADRRREALEALLAAGDPQLVPILQSLVQQPSLRSAALAGLAQYDDPKTASVVLDVYPQLSPAEKRVALQTLCSRTAYASALLSAVDAGKVPGTDLTADLVRQLQYLKDDQIDRRIQQVWGSVRDTAADKAELIASYKKLLASPGDADAALGRAVFAKTCQRCHVLYGEGGKVGPDLTGSNRSDLDYLLSNIVDPSAVMAKEYRQSIVITLDGRVIAGIVKSEDEKSITMQTAEAQIIIPKGEVDQRVSSDQSMMPDDQLKQFSDHEFRSLVAYLTGKQQVPMLATAENAASLFNGQDLSGWNGDPQLWSVEDGQIVGRSNGLSHNQWLVSDLTAEDFRFTVEVKLVDNAGNSGIQFRSEGSPDHVSGYQADIGAGWWGKLYEEHGRKLLWDKSGESHVKPGDWNQYVIHAQGSHIRTFINGKPCVDLQDPEGARRGVFAFQLHSGGPTEVRLRNLRLEVLGDEAAKENQAAAVNAGQ